MNPLRSSPFFALCAALGLAFPAAGQVKVGQVAPDFPPGVFSDGRQYRLSDFRGKIVVLYFYENKSPRCRNSVPQRNALVRAFAGQPVQFIAIGAGDSPYQAAGYARLTGLAMPVFADQFNLMERRYGQVINTTNDSQVRVIGPDGTIIGTIMEKKELEKLVKKYTPGWKYKGKDYPAKLNPALEYLEYGKLTHGVKLLGSLRRNPRREVAAAASKLYAQFRKEAEEWKKEADRLKEGKPLQSYDLYLKLVTMFPKDPLGKAAVAEAKMLTKNEDVAKELAARRYYDRAISAFPSIPAKKKKEAGKLFRVIEQKWPTTPTGLKAARLAGELGG